MYKLQTRLVQLRDQNKKSKKAKNLRIVRIELSIDKDTQRSET